MLTVAFIVVMMSRTSRRLFSAEYVQQYVAHVSFGRMLDILVTEVDLAINGELLVEEPVALVSLVTTNTMNEYIFIHQLCLFAVVNFFFMLV